MTMTQRVVKTAPMPLTTRTPAAVAVENNTPVKTADNDDDDDPASDGAGADDSDDEDYVEGILYEITSGVSYVTKAGIF